MAGGRWASYTSAVVAPLPVRPPAAARDPAEPAEPAREANLYQAVAACVERAAAGDQAAYGEVYRLLKSRVKRLAAGFAALGPDEVDDVVQETFIRAFRALPQVRDPLSFTGYVLTVARRCALASAGGRRPATASIDEGEIADQLQAPSVTAQIELEKNVLLVRELIDELPEGPEKETVRLFYVEGELSAREIAERQGVGKSAVTMRLERFRARIKRELLRRVLATQLE